MLKHWLLALKGVVIVAARLRGVHPRWVVIRMLRVGHKCVGVAPPVLKCEVFPQYPRGYKMNAVLPGGFHCRVRNDGFFGVIRFILQNDAV
jgi:hypothetical protein